MFPHEKEVKVLLLTTSQSYSSTVNMQFTVLHNIFKSVTVHFFKDLTENYLG